MPTQLSTTELERTQTLLQTYAAAQPALTALTQNNGDLEASLSDLLSAETSRESYGLDSDRLRTVFLKNLRREICGDDSFREKVETYSKHPGKAELLTGLIVYVIDIVTLPINPAIAAIAVLWILKLGLRTFCDYTDPDQALPKQLDQRKENRLRPPHDQQ